MMDKQMIQEMAQDIKEALKVAGEWLMAETKRIFQEKGAFHSAEHTKTMSEIVAEELTKKGYSKSRAEIERLNMAVDMLDYETAIKEECIQRLELESGYLKTCADQFLADYGKVQNGIKEALTKILGFCADDEVGMKYLIKRTAKEYGVEL
jgi:hypothetical protein